MFKDAWRDPVHGKLYSLDTRDGKWKDSEGNQINWKDQLEAEKTSWTEAKEHSVDSGVRIDRRQIIPAKSEIEKRYMELCLELINLPWWRVLRRIILRIKIKSYEKTLSRS